VVPKDPRVITLRRSTIVRIGVVALVLVAVGIGIAIGYNLRVTPSPTTKSDADRTSTTTSEGSSATTSPLSSTTTSAGSSSVPAVLPCGPATTPTVRPTNLTVDCATGGTTVTGITWNSWGSATGGQGTGTLNVNNCQPDCAHGTSKSASAIVVVFHPVLGIFQDVSITPTQDVSNKKKTPLTTRSTVPLTTTIPGGLLPVDASQPGTGWGGD
jgi:septal ring-binding cell division protein DamX